MAVRRQKAFAEIAGTMLRSRIVIVGAGFGGLWAAKGLRKAPVDVTLIDRANHHVFQPLLYQVATAGLSPANIAVPIRTILRRQENVDVVLGDVTEIDLERQQVAASGKSYPYDFLILATGVRHGYFGRPEWERYAPGLKSLDDALRVRRKILMAFERAELESDPRARQSWLNFVIVGAGPTGVELAGSIAELSHHTLADEYRHIDPGEAKVIVIEAGDRVLSTFDPSLSEAAKESLEHLGVEVRLAEPATAIDAEGVTTSRGFIPTRTVLWAAGVEASPVGNWLSSPTDPQGRVIVHPDLSVPNRPNVFVIGDAMRIGGADLTPLPGVAQVAMQQGAYVARKLAASIRRGSDIGPFEYKNLGSMATIGRSSAVYESGDVKLKGFIAWCGWLFVHLINLIGFANRILVLIQWAWAYVFWQRGARLITPVDERSIVDGS